MFASSNRLEVASRILAALAFGAVVLAACDDPLKPRSIPERTRLGLFLLLDPDSDTNAILVMQPAKTSKLLLRGRMTEDGALVADIEAGADTSFYGHYTEMEPCRYLYKPGFSPFETIPDLRCIGMLPTPRAGATYEVTVEAPGMSTARATTTIPGDFAIVGGEFLGSPPGTVRVTNLTWTRSAGAFRYVVAFSSREFSQGPCSPDPSCHDRWLAVTEDTVLSSALINSKYFASVSPPYTLTVFAVNRDLFGYLTTGSTSDYFPVPPAQNVAGGFGGVGAWVRRSMQVP